METPGARRIKDTNGGHETVTKTEFVDTASWHFTSRHVSSSIVDVGSGIL